MKSGGLSLVEEHSVVSVTGNANAEVLLHPNRRWVYVSSRGVGSVTLFHLNVTNGAKLTPVLTKVQEIRLTGTWPRSMALSPQGNNNADILRVQSRDYS